MAISDLKPYPAYKDSGVPWLGRIPAHWDVARNGRLFVRRNEPGTPDLPVLEVSLKTGVRIRRFEDAGRKQVLSDSSGYRRAVQGDIAYNMMRMWQGAVGVAPTDGLVSPAYIIARPLAGIDSKYYAYLFRTGVYMEEVGKYSRGIVKDRNRLYWEDFKQISSVFPPPEEQSAIARLLDYFDRRIRRYVRAKRRLIALLHQQREGITHRAVARGLEPDVRLKPSGVDWLGDVPAHWEVVTLGAVAESIQTGPFGSQLHAGEYIREGTPVINPSHMRDGLIRPDRQATVNEAKARELVRHRLQAGDLVAARRGELGRCALVRQENEGWLCGTGSLRIRCRRGVLDPGYLAQVFVSRGVHDALSISSIGATMENLNAGVVGRLRLPCPPLGEQARIMSHVESEDRRIGAAVAVVARQMALVLEYRTRLVVDVVTGRLDVSGAAAKPPDEPDEPLAPDEIDMAGGEEEPEEVDPDASTMDGEA